MSREQLAELLWPHAAVKDPNHSLDQLLTITRNATGVRTLFTGGAWLRLDHCEVHTDVADFESAHRDHRLEEMTALYRAAFAEGFSAGGLDALDRFLDAARVRYAQLHANALRSLAESAEARGDHAESVLRWQRLHETDRMNTDVAVRLLAALAASGRAHDALRIARGVAALQRAELELEDAQLSSWMGRLEIVIRDGPPSTESALTSPPAPLSPGLSRSRNRHDGAEERIGRVVGGRYRLEKVLRPGSIVTTYLGVDGIGELGMIEVHVLEPLVSAATPSEHFLAVFHRVMGLSHATILPTIDAGVDDAIRYVITARRPALSLSERLERDRQLPIDEAVVLAHDMAVALAQAHARGLHHGDLRPKHVALAGERACVGGFGFAESILPGDLHSRTSAVVSIGSTLYQSPELVMGEVRFGARADVYAFGCVLFEMLVGRPPFGGTGPSTMLKLTQPASDVREFRETVPESLAGIVRVCLARVSADRYASGEALLRATAVLRVASA